MNKKIFKNIIIVLAVVVILSGSFIVPAYAADYNFKDYITSEDISTDNSKYTVSFPRALQTISIVSLKTVYGTDSITYDLPFTTVPVDRTNQPINMSFSPLGGTNYLVLDNIVNGSVFTFTASFNLSLNKASAGNITYDTYLAFRYFDKDHNLLSSQFDDVDKLFLFDAGTTSLTINDTRSITVNKPAGAVYCFPVFYITQNSLYTPGTATGVQITYRKNSYSMSFNTSTDYLLSEALQVDNDLKQELVDGQKDIISGTPQQNAAANSMKDHMDDSISDLESAGDALESVDKPDLSDVNFNPDILGAQSYLAVVNCINSFWENPTILAMVLTLAIVMMIAVVLFGLRR